jgi:pyruvate/2-oxoglutarate dehydrogenase complex dihydrolipoamide dehydrogenase (E3) component
LRRYHIALVRRYDAFVVGGGAAGSEVAFSLARRSRLRIGLAERDRLGGECNHYGCVPTKVMLRSARAAAAARRAGRLGVRVGPVEVDFAAVMDRVRSVIEGFSGGGTRPFEEAGVEVLLEEVRLVGPGRLETASGERVEAERIVLATGTEATAPPVDGLAGAPFWTNREAIWEPTGVPGSLLVLGAGPIGCEFAQIYARFGARVTVVEALDRALPGEDADASAALAEALAADGIALVAGARASRIEHGPAGWRLHLEGRDRPLEAERLLVATGRRPRLDGHDLEAAGVRLDEAGRPLLGETLRTTGEGIWVAGDATGELLFTHVGSYEAEVVADDILGRPRPRDYRVVPRVTYTEPEVASVGLTEDQARSAGREVATSLLRMADNERAVIDDAPLGLVKLVADRSTGELLGGHIVAEAAGEMIHEVVAAMAARAPIPGVAGAIHAYPTLAESVKAAFAALAERLA